MRSATLYAACDIKSINRAHLFLRTDISIHVSVDKRYASRCSQVKPGALVVLSWRDGKKELADEFGEMDARRNDLRRPLLVVNWQPQ